MPRIYDLENLHLNLKNKASTSITFLFSSFRTKSNCRFFSTTIFAYLQNFQSVVRFASISGVSNNPAFSKIKSALRFAQKKYDLIAGLKGNAALGASNIKFMTSFGVWLTKSFGSSYSWRRWKKKDPARFIIDKRPVVNYIWAIANAIPHRFSLVNSLHGKYMEWVRREMQQIIDESARFIANNAEVLWTSDCEDRLTTGTQ